MIICICNNISDRDIRHTVQQGLASCVDSVREITGAGDCCGACTCKVQDLLQQEVSANLSQPVNSVAA